MDADYTKQCPLCGCEVVTMREDWKEWGDNVYGCDHCRSEWSVSDGDYEVIEDNTDRIDPSTIASRCK